MALSRRRYLLCIMRLERGIGKREHYSPAFVSDDDGFWNEARIAQAFKASVNILYGTSGAKPGSCVLEPFHNCNCLQYQICLRNMS